MAYIKGVLGLFLGLVVGAFFSKPIVFGLAAGLSVFEVSLSLDTWTIFQAIFAWCFGIFCGIANYHRHLNAIKSKEPKVIPEPTEKD